MTHIMERNIRALLERRRQEEQDASWQDRLARRITFFTGSLRFVYLHLALFGLWVVINLPWVRLPHFDPTFVVLAMVASVEAIFLSTFILISQNRMQAQDEKRAELDLQISLLAEHEITQAIQLLDAIAERLGINRGQDLKVDEAKQDVDPSLVYQAITERQQQLRNRHST